MAACRHRAVAALVLAVAAAGSACGTPNDEARAESPTCEQIAAFAEQLVDTGITYDYEPTDGPADLAARADLVIRGELTGVVTSQEAASEAESAYIAYEVAVSEVLAGQADHEGESIVVSVPHASVVDADAYAQVASAGTPVIVFAHAWPPAPGDFVSSVMEGFLTACPGQPPIGFAASYRGWTAVSSLDDVATAVREGQQ